MSTAFSRRVRKRKLKSDINVVPYIDVMLVLLVIFMITAPLLNLGTDIELPQSNAKALETKKDPVLVTVDRDGGYQMRMAADQDLERVDLATMGLRLKALANANPQLAVILAGDTAVSYGRVSEAMDYISAAGIQHITLLGKPPESGKPGAR